MRIPFISTKKEKQNKKVSKKVRRIVAGVIIGGAIASIVGKTLLDERQKMVGGGEEDEKD